MKVIDMAEFDPEKLKSSKPTFDPSRLNGEKAEKRFTPTYGEGSFDAGPSAPVQEQPIISSTTSTKTPGLFAGQEGQFDPTGKGLSGDPTMRRVMGESAIKGIFGAGSGIESLLRSAFLPSEIKEKYPKSMETLIPTPERAAKKYGFGDVPEAYKPASEFAEMVGEQAAFLGAGEVPAAVRGVSAVGKKGVQLGADLLGKGPEFLDLVRKKGSKQAIQDIAESIKSGKIEKDVIPQRGVTPEELKVISNSIQNSPTVDVIGDTMILKPINENINALKLQRQKLAGETYGAARESMNSRYAAGDFWQTSTPGQKLISRLESELKPKTGLTEVSVVEENEIRTLLRDLKGKEVEVPGNRILSETGEPVAAPTTKLEPTSPDVLRETLRRLRDRSNGAIAEGYAAISQNRARSLADELSKSLGEWDGTLAKADKIYKEQSELLHPTRTKRGKAATATEKFDMSELAADPKSIPGKFFNSRQGVEQFTDLVGGNKAVVEQAAENYVNSQLRGKNPDQMRTWLNSNKSWLDYDTLPSTMQKTADKVYRLEYGQLREPIATLQAQIENNLIADKEITAKLRNVLKTEGLPSEPVKRIAEELNRIDKLTDKEQAARDFAKKLALYIGLPSVGVYVAK
jgi:hypothetical protein